MPKTYRTSQSFEVADLIRSGFSVTEALRRILLMSDGTTVPTADVLADLENMGVWSPKPIRVIELRRNLPLYRKAKLIRGECWTFHALVYTSDEERRLLRTTFTTEAAAREAAAEAGVTPSVI